MTGLSQRFVAPALLLLLAAAVPVWMHQLRPGYDDCANPAQLLEAGRIEGTRRYGELSKYYGARQFQWTQGRIARPDGAAYPLRFRIIRSFEPQSLYGAPHQYFFRYATPSDPTELRWLDAGGERLPVHWRIETSTPVPLLLQYLFVQRGRPIRHPFAAGLASLVPQLLRGTHPVTLFVVFGADERSTTEAMQRQADAWLVSAWQHYVEACVR